MRRSEPSATAAGFDHRLRGRAPSILAVTLLCLLGEVAQAATPPGPAPRTRRPPNAERQTQGRAAERRAPNQPALASPTDEKFNECHKIPRGKRAIRVSLPSHTDLNHLIRWLSSVTCKAIVYATDEAAAREREVTIVAPTYVTPEEAFQLVLDALDALGLTLRPSGTFLQIIESQYAHVTSIPVYDYGGRPVREK